MRQSYAEGRRRNSQARQRGGKYKCVGCGKDILPNLNRAPVFTCKDCKGLAGELRALLKALEKIKRCKLKTTPIVLVLASQFPGHVCVKSCK